MKIGTNQLYVAVIGLAIILIGVSQADNGRYRSSAHSSQSTGVWRTPEFARGSCAQCHTSHGDGTPTQYGLFEENSNRLCFGASLGGCHADRPTGATLGYPAQETDRMPTGSSDPGYFEYNIGGQRVPGVQNLVRWPGQLVWEDPLFSPHYADPDMPLKDLYGNGACDNCHNVHGSSNAHDILDTTYRGIVGSQNGTLPVNYALCLNCHSQFGPPGMDDTSRMISYYYDRSINPRGHTGHGFGGSGYVPSNSRMPCFNCHNAHGSIGNGNAGGNRYLISDQRPGWYGLTDIKNNNAQVRRFCFGCHRSSDGLGGGTVEGVTLGQLPREGSVHQYTGTTHCYDCHGRDYSTPTGHNVHNPVEP